MRKSAPNGDFECVELDLDSLDAVMQCATAVRKLAPALHVLVLNAGAHSSRFCVCVCLLSRLCVSPSLCASVCIYLFVCLGQRVQ